MMNFRTAKQNLVGLLGDAAAARFVVIGAQRTSEAAENVLDNSRTVQVFYASGEFPRSSGRSRGNVQHDVSFNIELTAAKACEVDLTAINDPSATAQEIANAIAEFQGAAELVDDSMDELIDLVYQILMDATVYDIGFTKGLVSNRWVTNVKKNNPLPRGEYVILTASMVFEFRLAEEIVGAIAVPAGEFDANIDIAGDDTERTGVSGILGSPSNIVQSFVLGDMTLNGGDIGLFMGDFFNK